MSPEPAESRRGGSAPIAALPRRRPRYFAWAAAFLGLAAVSGYYLWQSRTLPIDAVVVKPVTVEAGPAWLSAALTDEIAETLRPSLAATADPQLTGVFELRIGPGGRATGQLYRGDGHRYWTRAFSGSFDEIVLDSAAAIVPSVRKRAPRHKPSRAAYDRYLEGRQAFARREYNEAVTAFEAATQADPSFAAAAAWVAIAREAVVERAAARPNEVLPSARDAAERAVTLDPGSPETHLALGIVRLQYDWEWESARREFDRALQLDRRHPLALQWRERWNAAMTGSPAAAVELPAPPPDPDSARRLLSQADDLRAQSYVTPLSFVMAAGVAHDLDSLFRWLDIAYDERCPQLPYLLHSPALPHSDPRLDELIRRLKLPTNP